MDGRDPNWSTFGMRDYFDQTLKWFRSACLSDAPYELRSSGTWTDDPWFLDQEDRLLEPSDGWWVLNSGNAHGRLVGGNLCTPQPAARHAALARPRGSPSWRSRTMSCPTLSSSHAT